MMADFKDKEPCNAIAERHFDFIARIFVNLSKKTQNHQNLKKNLLKI